MKFLLLLLSRVLKRILSAITPAEPDIQIHFRVRLSGVDLEIKKMHLREAMRVLLTLLFTTLSGHHAAHQEGSVRWESSHPDIVSVEVDPEDETKAWVTCLNGSEDKVVTISAFADGDPDEGEERLIVGTFDVLTSPGEAAIVRLQAGESEEVPTDAPAEEEPTDETDTDPAAVAGGDDEL